MSGVVHEEPDSVPLMTVYVACAWCLGNVIRGLKVSDIPLPCISIHSTHT